MKKSYRILQLQFYKGTHTHTSYINPENSPSRIQFYMQKTKISSSTTITTTYRGQRDLHSRKEILTHRRQGDLLEIHPCVLQDLPKTFQAFQLQDLPKAFQTFQTFQTFQSFMTFQPFQAILQIPVSPGNPPHSSILQLECIFYIFYKFYSSIGFHRNSTEYQLNNTNILQTLHSSKKGRCCDIGQNMYRLRCQDDIFSRIELIPSIVLSSKRLITRMTFNSFLSCLMSKESMEITINTSKWHECAKQWNGNSHISS